MNKLTNNETIFSFNQKAYSSLAEEYNQKFTSRVRLNSPLVKDFTQDLRCKTGKNQPNILDVGCAVGTCTYSLVAEGCQVVGLDVSSKMLALAKKNVPRATFNVGNFYKYQFSNTYDGIFAQNFIHLFPKSMAEKIIIKMGNLLKTNGLIYLSTTNERVSKEGFYPKQGYCQEVIRFRKFWKFDELEETIKNLGFKIFKSYKTKPEGGYPWMIFEIEKFN